MNKSYTPVSIPTFSDGESMDDVRVKTINPLTAETSRLGSHMDSLSKTSIKHESTINSHSVKIAALEAGGGTDVGPLTSRVQKNENDIVNLDDRVDTVEVDQVTMKGQITAHTTRITALEAGGGSGGGGGSTTFTGLTDTPSVLTPNHFLKVNAAGTALELDPHTHQKVDARQIIYPWSHEDLPGSGAKTIPKEVVATRSFFISAASQTGRTVTFQMPDIATNDVAPTVTEVNGGRIFIFTNTGASDFVLTSTTHKISYGPGTSALDTITIKPGKFVHVMAVCSSAVSPYKNYHIIAAGDTAAFV